MSGDFLTLGKIQELQDGGLKMADSRWRTQDGGLKVAAMQKYWRHFPVIWRHLSILRTSKEYILDILLDVLKILLISVRMVLISLRVWTEFEYVVPLKDSLQKRSTSSLSFFSGVLSGRAREYVLKINSQFACSVTRLNFKKWQITTWHSVYFEIFSSWSISLLAWLILWG